MGYNLETSSTFQQRYLHIYILLWICMKWNQLRNTNKWSKNYYIYELLCVRCAVHQYSCFLLSFIYYYFLFCIFIVNFWLKRQINNNLIKSWKKQRDPKRKKNDKANEKRDREKNKKYDLTKDENNPNK